MSCSHFSIKPHAYIFKFVNFQGSRNDSLSHVLVLLSVIILFNKAGLFKLQKKTKRTFLGRMIYK